MPATEGRRTFAFAPGHVTGLFVPALSARDPRGRGSLGAGIVLEVGATADALVEPSRPESIAVVDAAGRPLPLTLEAARHLVPPGSGGVRIRVHHALPVGQGFGMSAAGSLASALALAALFDLPHRRAVEAAHLAELFGRGGLGGVAAILGGGVEVRQRPGLPPRGRIVHLPLEPPVVVGVVGGPLPSPRLLADGKFLGRVEEVGGPIIRRLGNRPTPAQVLRGSEQFTDGLGRAPARLRAILDGLRRRGSWAAQGMLGRSFFAVPRRPGALEAALTFLRREGIPARAMGAAPEGARRLRGVPSPTPKGSRPLPGGRLGRARGGRPRLPGVPRRGSGAEPRRTDRSSPGPAIGDARRAGADASILTARPSRRRP